ncbi:MAG: YfcC family protein [Acidobacteria bacterium]|nr:YfcC family protein [Acidobacteriota bacterium]MXZ70099.1 YfcC family protein [Acidobacteriota bacterium]MYD72084.1 YfcC family protein [Acidobacteriota bacterium]MYJ03130.1 YfcC family protein [Acidobacteriota bacterium]
MRRFPDSLVLILALILLAQVAGWVLPAGEFEREGQRVVAGTYHAVEAEPLPPLAFLTSIPAGLGAAQEIIFFVFLVGGVIGVVRATGAIDAAIGAAIVRLGGRPAWLIGGAVGLFALGSSTIGMAEEYMPFVPILVTMCLALRLDAIVAVGIIYVGAGVGYACAAFNPFTVLIAQDIAGVTLTSGQAPRWALLLVCGAVGVHHIMRYAARVRAEPAASLVRGVDYSDGFALPEDQRFTARRRAVLAILAGGIGLFVWGVAARGWYLTELSAVFLAIGLICAAVAGVAPNRAARAFLGGASEMTATALLIGFARTIEVVLSDARVIDTIVYGLAEPLAALPSHAAALGMLAVQTTANFFIPSGSGQAYVTMPIMAPLADLTGVTRQTAVLAFQFGDGFTNMLIPTNALLMGMLALGRIPYQRWLAFVAPLLVKLYLVAAVALVVAVQFGYD